jgi:DNA-binding response OmpR family regulator
MNEDAARILVVDDDEIIIRVITATLERAGMSVTAAHDGLSALSKLEEIKPGLVLLDIRMPGMDGYEVLKRIRAKYQVPVIMFTTVTDTKAIEVCLALGADDYIEKPFFPWELLAHVKAKLRRSAWNEPIHI